MRLEQLKYVVEIYHTHSLSQAAKNLSLSQPSLSNALAALEEEWGVKLFHRLTTGVIPTEEGELLIPQVAAALNDLTQLYTVRCQPSAADSIHLLAAPAICSGLLPQTILAFQKRYPDVPITILEIRSEYLLEKLSDYPGYLGLCAYDTSIEPHYRSQAESRDFLIELLYLDHFVCCAPAGSALLQQKQLTRETLQPYTAIHYSSLVFGEQLAADEESHQFPLTLYQNSSAIGVDTLESLKKLIASGTGSSILPRCALYRDLYLAAGQITALPFEEDRILFYHHLLLPQKHILSPVETAFIDQLKQSYGEMAAYFSSHPL